MTEEVQHVDVLLVGGGVASAAAADELRAQGFDGSIALASRENEPPYYRFYLTKEYLRGKIARDDLQVHSPEWWCDNNVELWLRSPVMNLDLAAHSAKVGRRTVSWSQVLLATGANVRTLACPGAGLAGVHYLRTTWNADALRDEMNTARTALVIGGSFVAAETAASLASTGLSTTMVYPEALPLERVLGAEMGLIVAAELKRLGVSLLPGVTVNEIAGEDRVSGAVLSTGETLATDIVVVGIGARPETMLAAKAGLDLADIGGVLCDSALRTPTDGTVFAAGDVCAFDSVHHGGVVRIEHDRVAAAQGAHAARSMLGGTEPFDAIPYFWTSIGEDLRIDVLSTAGESAPFEEISLPRNPDLAGHQPMGARETALRGFSQTADGATRGLASINGALHLDVARTMLASHVRPVPAGDPA